MDWDKVNDWVLKKIVKHVGHELVAGSYTTASGYEVYTIRCASCDADMFDSSIPPDKIGKNREVSIHHGLGTGHKSLSMDEFDQFEAYARENLPGRSDWSAFHPVCRKVWWGLACQHDGLAPNAPFSVFSEDNPYFKEA